MRGLGGSGRVYVLFSLLFYLVLEMGVLMIDIGPSTHVPRFKYPPFAFRITRPLF